MDIIETLKTSGFGKYLLTFFVSMVPTVELTGALPLGVACGLPVLTSAIVSTVGNTLPVPFIILFVRKVFELMRRLSKRLGKIADWFETRAVAKSKGIYNSQIIGLLLFVALPFPGTGVWTGALIAALLDIRLRAAMPAIAAGILINAIIVAGLTFGFKSLLF